MWSGKDEGFVRVPGDDEFRDVLDADATYVHITSTRRSIGSSSRRRRRFRRGSVVRRLVVGLLLRLVMSRATR